MKTCILDLDERDQIIVETLQKDPNASQEELGKILKLSQPSVSARIRRLKEKGIIQHVVGVNFKKVDLHIAKVDISTTDSKGVLKEFEDCPFFLNALITSGKHNLCLFFMANDLKRLEGIVDHHIRSDPKVKDIEMNIVITPTKDLVLPLRIASTNKRQQDCPQHCAECFEAPKKKYKVVKR